MSEPLTLKEWELLVNDDAAVITDAIRTQASTPRGAG